MASQPKRPAIPAPDPNWELELHAPLVAGLRKPVSEGRDELLAHALLRKEPAPFEAAEEFGDGESRRTLPPPGSMSDHVARLMAEANERFYQKGETSPGLRALLERSSHARR